MAANTVRSTLTLMKSGGTATLDLAVKNDGRVSYNEVDPVAATGVVTFGGLPLDGETVTITDGYGNEVVFEFDDDVSVTAGNTSVTIAGSATLTADNFVTALDASALDLTGVNAAGVVTVTHDNADSTGNDGTIDVTGATNVTKTAFSGGVDVVRRTINNRDDAKALWEAFAALDV